MSNLLLIMQSIALQYRQRRVNLGLTQAQAAAAAGMSRRTLSDFEGGGNRISLVNLTRLLNAVGLALTLRDAAIRPTLDELSDRYRGEDATPSPLKRVRPKRNV